MGGEEYSGGKTHALNNDRLDVVGPIYFFGCLFGSLQIGSIVDGDLTAFCGKFLGDQRP